MRRVHPLTALVRTVAAAPVLLRVAPSLSLFLAGYLRRFPTTDVGGNLVLHSHLPPLDSPAYARFVRLHLVDRIDGPSHAQVAVTARCPQRCAVCYNRDRVGRELDDRELRGAFEDLIASGVAWLGLTGGEPLLRNDLPELVALGRDRCAMKLFTTGLGATRDRAAALRDAGLFSVSVSIDHPDEAANDRGRGFPGAWRAALQAIEAFLAADGVHVSISAVLSRSDIQRAEAIDRLLAFAAAQGVHEVWLSEVKPTVASLWHDRFVLADDERRAVADRQDAWNAKLRAGLPGATLNYLGHFEGAEQFGCNAGRKMVYVDPFGEVCPCVFTPFSVGNLRERPLGSIVAGMRQRFPSGDRCFMNQNWPLVATLSGGRLPMDHGAAQALVEQADFGRRSAFNERYLSGRASARQAGR
jgi:MoaA/NifB/PqqE/SkfB family radical SAM enzyme